MVAAHSYVAGVRLHPVSTDEAIAAIDGFVRSGLPRQVVTVNLDFLRIAQRDQRFRKVLNSADLAVADGMPLLWLSRLRGQRIPERVAGVDLVAHLAGLAAERGYTIFLLGAAEGIAAAAARALVERYPALRPPGCYAPPVGEWDAAQEDEIIERIAAVRPELLFVALGAPRQDIWLRDNLERLGVPVCIGVGGSLDILAGRKPRAPQWMQQVGLEWAHRLRCEPRRLWRRYVVEDLPFFCRLAVRHAVSTTEPAI